MCGKVLKPRGKRSQKEQELQRVLQLRAWIIHWGYNVLFIMHWVLGTGVWVIEPKACSRLQAEQQLSDTSAGLAAEDAPAVDIESEAVGVGGKDENGVLCVELEFNEEFVMESRPYVQQFIMFLIVFGILVDISVFKWRSNANIIFYIAALNGFASAFLPVQGSSVSEVIISVHHLLVFVFFYTDVNGQIIVIAIRHFLHTFVIEVIVFNGKLSAAIVLEKAFYVLGVLVLICLIAVVVIYISQL